MRSKIFSWILFPSIIIIVVFNIGCDGCDGNNTNICNVDYHLDCDKYDNSEFNFKKIYFICSEEKDVNFIRQNIEQITMPISCNDSIIVFKPFIVFGAKDSINLVSIFDCLQKSSDGDPKNINYINRIYKQAINEFCWNRIYDNITYDSTMIINPLLLSGNRIYTEKIQLVNLSSDSEISGQNESSNGSIITNISIKEIKKLIVDSTCIDINKSLVFLRNHSFGSKEFGVAIPPFVLQKNELLTQASKIRDEKKRAEAYVTIKDNLSQYYTSEPTHWSELCLLARSFLLTGPRDSVVIEKILDYLVKAAHNAISENQSSNMILYINTYRFEAFKSLFESESRHSAIFDGIRIGLEKQSREYIGVPINFMVKNKKGVSVINLDPDKLYIYKGSHFGQFRVGISDFIKEAGSFSLTLNYPDANGMVHEYRNVPFGTHESVPFNILNNSKVFTIINLTEIGNPFVTVGIREEKRQTVNMGGKMQDNAEGAVGSNGVSGGKDKITEESDFDGDKYPDSIDKCVKRFGVAPDGCPSINVVIPRDIYENQEVKLTLDYKDMPGDYVEWDSSEGLTGKYSLEPIFKVDKVGKYNVFLSIKNVGQSYQFSNSYSLYVKISQRELEKLCMKIADYGNYGFLHNTGNIAPSVVEDQLKAVRKFESIVDNQSIQMYKNGLIPESVKSTIAFWRTPKRTKETIIDSITIEKIDYNPSTGRINSIYYTQK